MKIIVATGASGGHIFPALAFLENLKSKYKNSRILLILPKNNITADMALYDYNVRYVDNLSFKFAFDFSTLKSLLNFIKTAINVLFLILKFQPDNVVGFGSLFSVPVVFLGWLFRIRTVIHEQNVVPGEANRFLSPFADKIAVSFEETKGYLKRHAHKITVTGNPLRKSLANVDKFSALDFFGLDEDKFTILVIGGSRGSHKINIEFIKAVSFMQDRHKFQVIHSSGEADFEMLRRQYEKLNIKFALFKFLEPIHYAYSASDLILSRAGATTISEIQFFKLPAILIPYPYAGKHQYENALMLKKKGCIDIIEDAQLNAQIISENLFFFLNNFNRLAQMRAGYGDFLKSNPSDLLLENAVCVGQ